MSKTANSVDVNKTDDPGETRKFGAISTYNVLERNTCINWNKPKHANNTPIPNILRRLNNKRIKKETIVPWRKNILICT